MITQKTLGAYIVIGLIVIGLIAFTIPQANARLVLINEFSPSAVTYTNKTMTFESGDPYGGYSYWTLSGGGTQQHSEYYYGMDCDGTPTEFEFFGFDEFVNHSFISAETNFKPFAAPGSTFDHVPLAYFYQKTALDDHKHWAVAVTLDEVGFSLVYNTGNGNTPTNTTLCAYPLPFDGGDKFDISLENVGDGLTSVYIYRTTWPAELFYSGSIQTGNYDARVLYAGFGEIAYTGINVWGNWFYLTIWDTIIPTPSSGTGYNKIDAYVDEEFAQTLYDVDGGANPIVDIEETVTNITLLIDCSLNSTTYDISTVAEGKNIIRLNITVTSTNGTIVFSQNNLTYISGVDYSDDLFLYQYSVQLDFTPIYGNIYTVIVTYEVYS